MMLALLVLLMLIALVCRMEGLGLAGQSDLERYAWSETGILLSATIVLSAGSRGLVLGCDAGWID